MAMHVRRSASRLASRRGFPWTAAFFAAAAAVMMLSPYLEDVFWNTVDAAVAESGAAAAIASVELPFGAKQAPDSGNKKDTGEGEKSGYQAAQSARKADIDGEPAAGSDMDELFTEPVESVAEIDGILKLLSAKRIAAVTISPKSDKGYVVSQGIYIKNSTKYDVDIDASLGKKLSLNVSGDEPRVMIVHTHGSESYSAPGRSYYFPSDPDRSDDISKNVVAVGNALASALEAKGIKSVHLTEMFDYPVYNGAYTRALEGIATQMKETPSISVVIDVHRDAMETESGIKYKTVSEVGGKEAAQMMLVVGTDEGGLPNSGWSKNLRFAIRLQKMMNEKYPGLMRPISLRKERFNQHVTDGGSLIIEFGTSGNTLDEALYSASLMGERLGTLLSEYK